MIRFDTNKLKLAGYAALAVVVAGVGGYAWARSVHKPAIVEVSQTACGVPATTAAFGVPLQTALRSGGGVPFGLGPIEVPQGGGPIRLTFDPAADGKGREVRMVDGALHLPIAFGRDNRAPERITLTCRDGALASVRYQGRDRRGSTFNVIREEATAAVAPGAYDRLDGAAAVEPAAATPSAN